MPDIQLRFNVDNRRGSGKAGSNHRRDKSKQLKTADRARLDIDETLCGAGVTAIYGASGAGKTTLLRCIAGLIHTPDGLCRIGNQTWQDNANFTPAHQRALGLVYQHSSLFEHLNVEQNLHYGLRRTSPAKRKVRYEDAIELLGLEKLSDRMSNELSGGERQRVAMAQALLRSPSLLLMDEPLASLDSDSKRAILPYLEHIHQALEIPLLYVSHSLDEILRIADNLVYLDRGRVIANGPINDLLVREDLPLAYLDEAAVVIEGTVRAEDIDNCLTEVDTKAGTFYVSGMGHSVNTALRLRIAARDVSVALSIRDASSLQHRLPAKIISLNSHHDPAKVLVTLGANGVPILASITRKSAHALGLKPGDEVYAQIKSVALV